MIVSILIISAALPVYCAQADNEVPQAEDNNETPEDGEEEVTTQPEPEFIEGSTFSGKPAYDESLGGFVYEPDGNGGYVITGYNEIERNIVIPDMIGDIPVTAIGETAFYGKGDILSVTVPDGVTVIGKDAFGDCKKLASVKLPASVREIGADAFRGCDMLRDIKLPSGLEVIGDSAFEGCTRLGKLTVPASLREIGVDAFLSCESLILECSGNPTAEEYAEHYSIPTSFTDTGGFQLMICAAIAVVLLAAVVIVKKTVKK